MEKIKLNNGHIYELAVNGIIETPDALSLTFLPADKTFEESSATSKQKLPPKRSTY